MPPLSASALGELRSLVAEASKDPSVLNAPELRELRDLMVKLGAKVPEPKPAAAPAAAPAGNEDLRDAECVDEPDVAEQEMADANAGEPSEEARSAAHGSLTARADSRCARRPSRRRRTPRAPPLRQLPAATGPRQW